MGSAIRCWLLQPSPAGSIKPDGSFTAGSSSPAVPKVPSPRNQPYSCSLTSSPPPETRARAEREQTRDARAPLYLLCNRDDLTKPRLSFVALRCSSSHPDACDICSYSHLETIFIELASNDNMYMYIRHICIYQIATMCIYGSDNIHTTDAYTYVEHATLSTQSHSLLASGVE